MCPLIALRDGKVTLGVATIGPSLIHETVRVLLEMLVANNDLTTVLSAPPLLLSIAQPSSGSAPPVIPLAVPARTYSPEFLARLQAQGVTVQERTPAEVATFRGVGQWRNSRRRDIRIEPWKSPAASFSRLGTDTED
jgi:hypothetical protein